MSPDSTSPTPRRGRLAKDLGLLALIFAMLIAAVGAGGLSLYREFYGPAAFVTDYLSMLSSGRAADALKVPGVTVDRNTLDKAGIDAQASEALLRKAALAPLKDVRVVSEKTDAAGTSTVTVKYEVAGHKAKSNFQVEQDGWQGILPHWRFSQTPLAAVSLNLRGADAFTVNDFEVDRAQLSADGVAANPLAPIPMLVFTPGLYSIGVDTPISATEGTTAVLTDTPLANTSVSVQAEATKKFVAVVQERVDEFLAKCTEQTVLQPTGCPFGLEVSNRIVDEPKWSIPTPATVTVHPDGAHWRIPPTSASAHIDVKIQSLFDGSVQDVSEDVMFLFDGTIEILADGSASIKIGAPVGLD